MYQLFEKIKAMKAESDAALSELRRKTEFTCQVMQDVYSDRKEALQAKQEVISRMLADGDFEAVMTKLAEADELLNQSPDEEIKERLCEYSFRKCN